MTESVKICIIANSYLNALGRALELAEEKWGLIVKLTIFSSKKRNELKIKSRFIESFYEIPEKPDGLLYRKIGKSLKDSDLTHCFLFFTRLIPKSIYEKVKVINFHPSILPAHAGLKGLESAIQDKHLGFTAHYVDETIDMGQVLRQFQIEPFPESHTESIRHDSSILCSATILSVVSEIRHIKSQPCQVFMNARECLEYVLKSRLRLN